MSTELNYGKVARAKIKAGVDKLADAVKVTLGAKGRNVMIGREPGRSPEITKDGVKVANSVVSLSDPWEDMGAQIIKGAARKTMSAAGDGTTTSTLLAQVMITAGIKKLDEGLNPMDLKRGMEIAIEAVIKNLKEQSVQIKDNLPMIINVAAIAANNDPELGEIIGSLMFSIGNDGFVNIAQSQSADTYTKIVEGVQFERGYIDKLFITNGPKMRVEFINPYILVYDKKISLVADIKNILTLVMDTGRPLLIIAEEVDSEALATLTNTKLKMGYPFAAVKAPFGGSDALEDIAVICGCSVISELKGQKLSAAKLTDLGTAENVAIDKNGTTIIGGAGKKEDVDLRISQIKESLAASTNDFEKEKILLPRLAKLSQGYATIYVGGNTDIEIGEKMDRVDDALRATRAAMQEGILPGGGIAYIRALQNALPIQGKNDGEDAGIEIIEVALEMPLAQILFNAGQYSETREAQIKSGSADYGFNVKNLTFENFYDTGIIDPLKVSRIALESAGSVAAMLLTTECAIVEIK